MITLCHSHKTKDCWRIPLVQLIILIFLILPRVIGDDMYHGDEQYKYLTNEGDLNNAHDDSIALTPKTPKKDDAKLAIASPITPLTTATQQEASQQAAAQPVVEVIEPKQQPEPIQHLTSVSNSNLTAQPNNNAPIGKKQQVVAGSVGNMSMAESMDGSFYAVNKLNADNIPIQEKPKNAG